MFFTDLLYDIMPEVVRVGISYHDFWDMTLGEIMCVLEAEVKRREEADKSRIVSDYSLAVMCGLACNGKLPPIYKIYPDMFPELEGKVETAKLKATMINYANAKGIKVVKKGAD